MTHGYAVHSSFASGGMATVHFGTVAGPGGFTRVVAIKRLHPHYAHDAEFVTMLLDEARMAGRVRHPNVVPTLNVVTSENEVLLVMEYVRGESLAILLRQVRTRRERVPPAIAAAIAVGVLQGLHAAHESSDEHGNPLRLVHRDVSPHNVIVGTDGLAHLIDFGIAKARGRAQVTKTSEVKGKLGYMSPEQIGAQPVDRRTDVFSASVVFWEALTGRRLFQAAHHVDPADLGSLFEHIEAPSTYAQDLGAKVDEIVMRGLAREPNDRYATARDMSLAIEAAMAVGTASQVGDWVECLASEALAGRSRQISEIELASAPAPATTVRGTLRMPVQKGSDPAEIRAEVTSTDVAPRSDAELAVLVTDPPRTGGPEQPAVPSFVGIPRNYGIGVWTLRRALWVVAATIGVPLALAGVPQLVVRLSHHEASPHANGHFTTRAQGLLPPSSPFPSLASDQERDDGAHEERPGTAPARATTPPSVTRRAATSPRPSRPLERLERLERLDKSDVF